MLCYAILYYTMIYYPILYYAILYYTILLHALGPLHRIEISEPCPTHAP